MSAPKSERPAGYSFLVDKYSITTMPNWHDSLVGATGKMRMSESGGRIETIFPSQYWPGDSAGDHLEFALKYDGTNLEILAAIFSRIDQKEITDWIASKSAGKYARKIWFLYEFLTGDTLPLPDLGRKNYVEILDPTMYYAVAPGRRVLRQRVVNNLPGGPEFCPIIRRTEKLAELESLDLRARCEEIVTEYPVEVLRRAVHYLYRKETKSSFEIERIEPSASRTEKFIGLLKIAEHEDFCEKSLLIDLQNRIVDPRFRDDAYRTTQNYIGETIAFQQQYIHFVCPKPEDLDSLMKGLLECHRIMRDGEVPAVIHAAVIAYGFVFLHPFEDGNGRLHRFLIHNILSLRGAVPQGLMFPVSAAMVKNPALYEQSLEAFSKPLLRRISYTVDDYGRMTVHGETGHFYRFIDLTVQAESLYDFVIRTIEHELAGELEFIVRYDDTKKAIQQIVDMPDRLIDLFITVCLQNDGLLSATKRKAQFNMLTDEEVVLMEAAIRKSYKNEGGLFQG